MSFLSSIAKITDYMYLCGERAITRTRLNKLGITDVVNCTLDVPNRMDPGIKCVQISIPDRPFSQLDVHFDRVSDLIHKVHSRGGKVLVHCVAGVSRSATLCIAYLMKHQNMTLFDAHHFVWTQRKIVRPNPGFWKQLIAYERKLHGRNTVKMVNSIVGGETKMASRSSLAKITDHLYLCGASAITQERLVRHGITHIINSTNDVPTIQVPGIQSLRIHVDDHPRARLDVHFDRVADEISHIASRGGKVVVHCAVGVSRSATLCIVYLMKQHKMTLVVAHDYVRGRRPIIRPNTGFWKQLIDYERKLFGRTTVKMINSVAGPIPDVYKEYARYLI